MGRFSLPDDQSAPWGRAIARGQFSTLLCFDVRHLPGSVLSCLFEDVVLESRQSTRWYLVADGVTVRIGCAAGVNTVHESAISATLTGSRGQEMNE